jgi:hypothetical protein
MVFGALLSLSTRSGRPFLCGGDKSGVSEKRFYQQLTDKADARFDAHIARIKKGKDKERK